MKEVKIGHVWHRLPWWCRWLWHTWYEWSETDVRRMGGERLFLRQCERCGLRQERQEQLNPFAGGSDHFQPFTVGEWVNCNPVR
jgi:hypothetical protein